MKKRPKILAVSIYIPGMSFTRVVDSIFQRISDSFDIHLIGINYKGPVLREAYTVYPNNLEGGDLYGSGQLESLLDQGKFDLVFFLNDFWMLKNYRFAVRKFKKDGGRVIAYAPLDGYIVSNQIFDELDYLDRIIVFNEFSKNELIKVLKEYRTTEFSRLIKNIDIVGHGVDQGSFCPLRANISNQNFQINREELRAQYCSDWGLPENAFLVLNANRFNERKRIDLTIEGFGKFAEGRDDVFLYLHQPVIQDDQKKEIFKWAEQWGCSDKILLNTFSESGGYASNEDLNIIYNLCDVGVNTTMGEGWGLISFEHALTGAAQIMPDSMAAEEIWGNHALYIKAKSRIRPDYTPYEMVEISTDSLADQLASVYSDRNKLIEFSNSAFEHAQNECFTWKSIAGKISTIFQRELNERKNSREYVINHQN